ncbi:MAG: N-acetyltransferase family protein [Pseudomonadota bacterium]
MERTETSLIVRTAQPVDGPRIAEIDAAGLATGHATFRQGPYDWETWQAAFADGLQLVAERQGEVLGWAGISATSTREVYRGVGEISVYVATEARGLGIGDALLSALIQDTEERGFWTLIAQIFPENAASVALHQRHGFNVLACRKGLGRMGYGPREGQWRDVLFLERRSTFTGQD